MWKTNLTKIIENEVGEDWKTYKDSAYDYYGNPGGLKKNPLTIARALKSAWENGLKSASLVKLVEDIVDFARKEGS